MNGKIWFVSALNVSIDIDESRAPEIDNHSYRGGVRHDGSKMNARYEVEQSTEEEIKTKR